MFPMSTAVLSIGKHPMTHEGVSDPSTAVPPRSKASLLSQSPAATAHQSKCSSVHSGGGGGEIIAAEEPGAVTRIGSVRMPAAWFVLYIEYSCIDPRLFLTNINLYKGPWGK